MSDNEKHKDICDCEKCREAFEQELSIIEEIDPEFASVIRKIVEEERKNIGSIV